MKTWRPTLRRHWKRVIPLFAATLGDIARAKGMSQLMRETGLGRKSLYKALSPTGNPEFAAVLQAVSALGPQLHAAPVAQNATSPLSEGRRVA